MEKINKKFAESDDSQNHLMESIYKLNVGLDISENCAEKALIEALTIEDESERSLFLGILLNGFMAKKPTLDEVFGFIKACFSVDDVDIFSRDEVIVDGERVVGVAGSGKKGFKTVNVSSCASLVASSAGAFVMKSCSKSTSSVTGSSDFAEAIGINLNCSNEKMMSILKKIGIGFFSIENQIRKFDSLYGGKFYAPHVLSFGLSGLMFPEKPNVLFYGLAHHNITLSMKLFNKFGFKNVFISTSSDDGVHYLDELNVFGVSKVVGSKKGVMGEEKSLKINEVLNLKKYKKSDIESKKNKEENVKAGLYAILGREKNAIRDIICVNAGTILFLADKVKNLEEGFALAASVIDSGLVQRKIVDLVVLSGGDLEKFNSYLHD